MPEKEVIGAVKVCPACGESIGSFQTKCPSCGHELNTAESAESVKAFFQKLDELAAKEYEANKQREGAKAKKNSPWPLRICEAVAVMSIILIILNITGISRMIRGEAANPDAIPVVTIVNNTGYEILEIYISPDDHWGQNWLANGQVLGNTQSESFTLHHPLREFSKYDIQLRDADGDTYTRSLTLSAENRIIFTFSNIDQ